MEQTTFHVTVPVAAAVEGVRAIADLAFRPWLRGRDLRAERPVVLEEIRGAEDDPADVLAEAMRARAWGPHPYGRPVLGTPRSVRGIRLRDLQAFLARWDR
ncbi:MAG: insulinase family protein, partial [bacterium]